MRARTLPYIFIFFLVSTLNLFSEKNNLELSKFLYDSYQLYEKKQYDKAVQSFLKILSSDVDEKTRFQAVFWLGKSYLGNSNYEDAELSFRNYVKYGSNKEYLEESRYLIGRTLFLKGEYEQAIDQLSAVFFNDQDSPYASHALYWMAEASFLLGDWNQAHDYYNYILEYYKKSDKQEASYYKINLINLLKRENRMLNLLNWTHEKHLNAQLEFRKREEDYVESIKFYQEKLETLSKEGRDLYNKKELIEIKEELLILKEFYLEEWGMLIRE